MTERLFVLLPPSLGTSVGGRSLRAPGTFDEVLDTPRAEVRSALADLLGRGSAKRLESAFSARGELLERALASTQRLLDGTAPLLPAWKRYQGVVWTHLAPDTLTSTLRRRILVPSGVYGLTDGEDPIADYRLKMNVTLAPLASLASFWRPFVTEAIDDTVKRAPVVDLLPKEHAVSVDVAALRARRRVINVRFRAFDDQSAVGHDAKAVKGALARAVLLEGTSALDGFLWRGWRSEREGDEVIVVAPRDATRRRT